MLALLALALSTAGLVAAQDPCTIASASPWISSKQAHACELNVPYDKNRSAAIIDTNIKSLQYYSLETWFINSPNPLIPHNVDIRSLLTNVQKKVATSGFPTDWDFNTAVTDAFDREADGHTIYQASCTVAFSYNLPVSIATLAKNPTDRHANPTLLVNYDFPNQVRAGLEDYYESLGVHVRPLDGAQILTINGHEASSYLVDLATRSSIYDGLFGAYETVNPRYMRLMARYSADTASGQYTLEVGRFGQRAFYPGADSVTFGLKLKDGSSKTVTIPWSARFIGQGNDTASFFQQTCVGDAGLARRRVDKRTPAKRDGIAQFASPLMHRLQAVEHLDIQEPVRQASVQGASLAAPSNYVTPNLTSVAHFVTLDVYQLKQHPKVGVMYFQQFEPSDGTDFNTYINGMSATIFQGLTALKKAGVKKVLIDNSGNRGGYIFAGAVSLWSLWPKDLYPGFPAVFRDGNLTQRESQHAASTDSQVSEYNFRFYRDLKYQPLTSNAQFLDPPVPQIINGRKDAYSHPFFDDFGNGSSTVTNFTQPPFNGDDYVFVANSICASTCSVFSSYLYQKHGVRSAVFGGTPDAAVSEFDGGVKGSEVTDFSTILAELNDAGLQNDPAAPQPFPISATLSLNYRNAIPYIHKEDGILEYVYEPGTKKYQFTPQLFNNPQATWEFVAGEFFPYL